MPVSSQYLHKAITCEGGLDLVTPKLLTAPGTLTDCMNFEVGVKAGYSRIDGFERFDGRASPSLAYTYFACALCTNSDVSAVQAGTPIYYQDTADILGYFTSYQLSGEDLYVFFVVTDYSLFVLLDTSNTMTVDSIVLTLQSAPTPGLQGLKTVGAITTYTVQDQMDDLNDQYKNLRSKIGPLIAGNWYKGVANQISPAIGLHLFKDNLYAIQDLSKYYFNTGTEEVFPGDTIKFSDATEATVREVILTSGTWVGGDAAGALFFSQNGYPTGSADLVRPVTTTTDALVIISSPVAAEDTDTAGLYVSSSSGWGFVETGWNFEFNNGTNAPNVLNRGEVTQTNLLHGDTGNMVPATISGDSSWSVAAWHSSTTATKLEAVSDYEEPTEPHTDSYNAYLTRAYVSGTVSYDLVADSFSAISSIPSDAVVTGVQVTVRGGGTQSGITDGDWAAEQWSLSVIPSIAGGTTSTTSVALGNGEYTFGGSEDLMGLSSDPTALTSLGFTVRFSKGNDNIGPGGTPVVAIDYIAVKIYYTQEVSEYYFWNGSDDVKAQVIDYYLTDITSDWSTNDATGVMQVYTITPVGSSDRRNIQTGDEIRSSPAGGGIKVADVTSDMIFSGLPGINALEANNSRYKMITANFYGNKDWEAIYGVNGAGRAFAYDGFYLRNIYTGLDSTLDKPRHVAFHQHSLAVGYNSGNVSLSVVGEPTNFRGVDGAVSFDVGDPVTGLLRMNGTTLGIFCSKSVHGLVGTSVNDFSVMILNPYDGAIEYTVVDIGGKPVYCSPRGITVFEQSDAYGDFLGNRLSTLITPWLLPRLQKQQPVIANDGNFANGPAQYPVVAIPCRSRNQYQLWFADGKRLTMTLVGLELRPSFTFQELWSYNNSEDFLKRIVPRAECSENYSNGDEGIFVSNGWDTTIGSFTNELGYVFSLNKGWTFDSHAIWGYIDINDNFFADPYTEDSIRKERVYGLSYGLFPLRTFLDSDYGNLTLTVAKLPETTPIPLPREDQQPTWITSDLVPVTNIMNTAKHGRSFSIKYYIPPVGNVMSSTEGQQVSPPAVIQAILVQHVEGKADI